MPNTTEQKSLYTSIAAAVFSLIAVFVTVGTHCDNSSRIERERVSNQTHEYLGLIAQLNDADAAENQLEHVFKDYDGVGEMQRAMMRKHLLILMRIEQLRPDVLKSYKGLPIQDLIIADAYLLQGREADADRYADLANDKGDSEVKAGALSILAATQFSRGSLDNGRKLYEKAIIAYGESELHSLAQTQGKSQVCAWWAGAEHAYGDYEHGTAAIKRGREYLQQLRGNSFKESAANYLDKIEERLKALQPPPDAKT